MLVCAKDWADDVCAGMAGLGMLESEEGRKGRGLDFMEGVIYARGMWRGWRFGMGVGGISDWG